MGLEGQCHQGQCHPGMPLTAKKAAAFAAQQRDAERDKNKAAKKRFAQDIEGQLEKIKRYLKDIEQSPIINEWKTKTRALNANKAAFRFFFNPNETEQLQIIFKTDSFGWQKMFENINLVKDKLQRNRERLISIRRRIPTNVDQEIPHADLDELGTITKKIRELCGEWDAILMQVGTVILPDLSNVLNSENITPDLSDVAAVGKLLERKMFDLQQTTADEFLLPEKMQEYVRDKTIKFQDLNRHVAVASKGWGQYATADVISLPLEDKNLNCAEVTVKALTLVNRFNERLPILITLSKGVQNALQTFVNDALS